MTLQLPKSVKRVAPIVPVQTTNEVQPEVCTADTWGDEITDDDGDLLPTPELQIIYGPWRVGKSHQYLDQVQTAHQINPATRVFIISTDDSLKRNLELFPYIVATKFVRIVSCINVDEVMDKTAQLVNSGFLNPLVDWIVIDLASMVWENLPDYWCRKALKRGCDDIAFANQQDSNSKKGNIILEYYKDHINPTWFKWESKIRATGCNVILVAGETPVKEEDLLNKQGNIILKADSDVIKQAYAGVGTPGGMMPSIQKKTAFQYHTILYFSKPYEGTFFVQTAGDKGGRKWLPRTDITKKGMGDWYLREIAQWKE